MAATERMSLPCAEIDCASLLIPLLAATLLSCILLGGMLVFSFGHSVFKPCLGGRLQWRRALVLIVLLMQVMVTILGMVRAIKTYAIHFGDITYFKSHTWEDTLGLALSIVIQTLSQLYLLERAFAFAPILQRRCRVVWSCTIFLALATLAGLGLGIAWVARGSIWGNDSRSNDALNGSADRSHRRLSNKLVVAWLCLGAFVDGSLTSVLTVELQRARKRAVGSVKSQLVSRTARRLAGVVLEAGLILTTVQLTTALIWIITSSSKARHNPGWFYFPILLLSPVYAATLIRFSASVHRRAETSDEEKQQARRRSQGSEHQHFSTVEYNWGGAVSCSGSEDGVPSVTGLPLDAMLSPTSPPLYLPSDDDLTRVSSRGVRHATSKHSLTSKKSLSIIRERENGASALAPSTSAPSQTYRSHFHSPHILESGPRSNPFDNWAESSESEASHPRSRLLGKFVEREGPSNKPRVSASARCDTSQENHFDISYPVPSEHTLRASARFCRSSPSHPARLTHNAEVQVDAELAEGGDDEERERSMGRRVG